MNYATETWRSFLEPNSAALWGGTKVRLPEWLAHPRDVGFVTTDLAENYGQTRDWVAATEAGGRLHVHEFQSGDMVLHLDRIDPAGGPIDGIVHWLTEAPRGRAAGAVVGGGLAAFALWKLFRALTK